MAETLPEYNNPPLVEVVLGVQFKKLKSLGIPQLGCIWDKFREGFPKTEEQPLLNSAWELFGPKVSGHANVQIEMSSQPLVPRILFVNESETELIQIQQDRFIRNWRKQGDSDEYPRYMQLRRFFKNDIQIFIDLCKTEKWGEVEPDQCEVTYVNIIPAGAEWEDHSQLGNVITIFQPKYSGDIVGELEDVNISARYVLKDEGDIPFARLHLSVTPVYLVADDKPAFRLSLTVRGKPATPNIDGIMNFLDQAHKSVVLSFATITSEKMHEKWEKKK